MQTLAFGHHEDRTPTHGYCATREAAMTAFAKKLAAGVNDQEAPMPTLPIKAIAVLALAIARPLAATGDCCTAGF